MNTQNKQPRTPSPSGGARRDKRVAYPSQTGGARRDKKAAHPSQTGGAKRDIRAAHPSQTGGAKHYKKAVKASPADGARNINTAGQSLSGKAGNGNKTANTPSANDMRGGRKAAHPAPPEAAAGTPQKLYAEIKAKIAAYLASWTPEPEKLRDPLLKSLAYGAVIVMTAIMQTTAFSRHTPFGATPDMMIFCVIVTAMFEGERGGTAAGIFAGFIIESLGGVSLSLLPLVYMFVGCFAGLVTRYVLTNSLPVFLVYVPCAAVVRAAVTLIYTSAVGKGYSLPRAFISAVAPEFGSTVIMCFLPALLTLGAARLFHHRKKKDA